MLDAATHERIHIPERTSSKPLIPAARPSGSHPVWCVVAALPKRERTAHAELHRRGFQAYLPLVTVRWRDRSLHIAPLFAGYLFVRLRLDQPWNPVRYAPGVFSLLSVDGTPSICPEAAVEAIRAGEAARSIPATPDSLYRPGAPCEAVLGGGSKVEAVVVAVNGQTARVLAVMFGEMREMTVELGSLRLRGE